MKCREELALAVFRDEFEKAEWQIPLLMHYAPVWIKHILPLVRRHSFRDKHRKMADNNEQGLRFGWELGEHNPLDRPLNQKAYDANAAGTEAVVAIAEAFTVDLRRGRNSKWKGKVLGVLPQFIGVKSRCPITGVPTGYE